jgi:hypothetical protein
MDMKKQFFFLTVLFCTLLIVACKFEGEKPTADDIDALVLETAQKYGLEDSIDMVLVKSNEGTSGPKIDDMETTALFIDALFAQRRRSIDRWHTKTIIMQKLRRAKSMQEYYEINESHPVWFEDEVKAAGSMEAYQQRKKEFLTPGKYKVYIGQDSVLTFVEQGDSYPYGKILFGS